MSIEIESLKETRSIEDNKQYKRLAGKTQVVSPEDDLEEVAENRVSHSYGTGTSTMMIGATLADRKGLPYAAIDYKASHYNVALSHDIGHPPFGHDGQKFISRYFIAKGLKEGFDDNNNNLVVIDKNGIKLRDYTKASIIKYPDRLYASQIPIYLPMLDKAINEDIEHYAQFGIDLSQAKRTFACEIMDEADRNTYTCGDISDFLCLGNKLDPKVVLGMAENFPGVDVSSVSSLIDVAVSGRKSDIKLFFSDLKERMNQNYQLSRNGFEIIDQDLINLREFINKLSFQFYIKPIRQMPFHLSNMEKLKVFIDRVVNHGFHPSRYYREKIETAQSKEDRLVALRDMISEVSDWYVITQCERFEPITKVSNDLDIIL